MGYIVVQQGDTLMRLSKQYHVSYQRLLATNPQIQDPNKIWPGQIIVLPPPHQRRPVSDVQRVVRPGDTMFKIAREFGVPLSQVINLNPFVHNPDLIYPGMILTIKRGSSCPQNVIDFVNRFMQRKVHGHVYDHLEFITTDASEKLDPRLFTGIKNPANNDYDFFSCYQRSHHDFVALVALYRHRRGFPGVYDIIVEHILVTMKDGHPKIADINVQIVLQVS